MSLIDDVAEYYHARANIYDESAGYTDKEAERLRVPIKARYQKIFKGHKVLEIACGTGYWTKVIGEVAESVHAIDINSSLIAIAQKRCRNLSNVTFQIADVYSLQGVPADFTAGCGIWWWSHIPQNFLTKFLDIFHSRLQSGSPVLFVDQLLYDTNMRRCSVQEDSLEERILPDGRSFLIVKNFPSEQYIENVLAGISDNVEYIERPDEKHWNLTYNTKRKNIEA